MAKQGIWVWERQKIMTIREIDNLNIGDEDIDIVKDFA